MNIPIDELITALNENTAALRAVLAASSATAAEPPAKGKGKAKPAPEPEPDPTPEPEPEPEESLTPTKVTTAPAKDDTPHVAAPVAPGQPEAGEHVDVDEVLAQIQSTLKKKMLEGDAKVVQDAFVTIRKSYGVERINELKGEPSKLIAILKKTQAL